MKVVITGGAGFLGSRLAAALLRRGTLSAPGGREESIDRIVLVDEVAPPAFTDPRIVAVAGDIADPELLKHVLTPDTPTVFHLAAIVSGRAEEDFDLGMRVNIDATRLLLEVCRSHAAGGQPPRVVFASSIAVYGGPLPETVLDTTAVRPQSSYGTQKAVAELLINDLSRRGVIDGRVLRLPTISVRPGRPNRAASSFASGIVREPLNGEDAVCPVDADTRLWLSSPSTAVEALIAGHEIPVGALGSNRNVNVPGISITAGEMVEALERVAGSQVAKRVRWERDPAVAGIVATWPGAVDASRARALGFPGDEGFDAIVRRYIDEELPTYRGSGSANT